MWERRATLLSGARRLASPGHMGTRNLTHRTRCVRLEAIGAMPLVGYDVAEENVLAKSHPICCAITAKSQAGTRRDPKRKAAPQLVLSLMKDNYAMSGWIDTSR